MTSLTLFSFEAQEIRVLMLDGEPWFVAKDIATIFGHSDVSMMCSSLDEDEKGTSIVCTPGGDTEMLIVNESGFYSLVLRSRKPIAKPFKRWVTREVLPSIRKNGSYQVDERGSGRKPETLQLPPADIRIVNLVSSLEKLNIEIQNPRWLQHIQDFAMNSILGVHALPEVKETWLGVVEKAEKMGYSVSLVNRHRSQLGKYVASQPLTRKQEPRLCNGTVRAINLYLDCPELDKTVSEFMDAKVLATSL